MAVSGRKSSDFKEALSVGSAEDFEICCDPCLSDGHTAKAKGFCVNCQENLCKLCLDAHKAVRVLKHHQVEDKARTRALMSTSQQGQSNICTEVCAIHSNEIIKFFCRKHETLGCSDCVTLDHRNCHIDYIPDVCTGIIKRNEFKTTLDEVTEKLKQSDDFREESNTRLAATRENITDAIKRIEDFQKRINEKTNTLKNKLMQDPKLAESSFAKHVDEALSQNDGISSDLKSIKANLETHQTTGHDAQAFVTMKQVQSRLKTLNISAFKAKLLAEIQKFEPNEALVDMLSTSDGLGRIVTVIEAQQVSSAVLLFSLTHDKDINLRTKSDKSRCKITSCALLSPGKLVVTDWNNTNVKIVDIKKQSLVEEYTLPSWPFDVAVLPDDQVAVTLPWRAEIRILKTREKLTTLCNIKVNRYCYGITYHQDLLYVLCQDPNSVLVLDMQGTVQLDIMLQSALNETFRCPLYSTISEKFNLKQVYISDRDSNMVVSLTLQGKVTTVYKNDEMENPHGIMVLHDGSLLVCCLGNGTIHHISADMKQGCNVAKGITRARSICHDSNSKTAYVGSEDCDHFRMFSLK